MAFNSITFVLAFLPLCLIGYYLLSGTKWLRLLFLTCASLFFYGRSQLYYVPLILGSAAFNYFLAVGMVRTRNQKVKNALLSFGVITNAGLLIFLKYFSDIFNALTATTHPLHIIAPLAISFYTFQQIAFLIDVSRERTRPGSLLEYLAFVTFFPQLLAGPISLHQEITPQFDQPLLSKTKLQNILFGLVIFSIGLFKKTVIADTLALWADPLFDGAAGGATLGFYAAWTAAATYTLQIYFDFSGYSDMAIGVARMFGITLPLNFFSPFRSHSIVEFWQRWHMTLGRFVRLYIFQPVAIPLARLAARTRLGRWTGHSVTTLTPTFLSMLIIGSWHGPSWTYVLFGAMQGLFMCTSEIFNFATKKYRRKHPDPQIAKAVFLILTVVAFALTAVPFRAANVPTSLEIMAGMFGFNGAESAINLVGSGLVAALLIVTGAVICALLPNTAQLLSAITPALEWDRWSKVDPAPLRLTFRFNYLWITYAALCLFFGLAFVSRGTQKFIYFNF